MSVQTVHFFRPPPPSLPSVQTNIFGFQNMAKYYDLQISVNIVYFQI